MATLAQLKRDLVSESAAISARKANGIDYKEQELKKSELVTQIMKMEAAEKRLNSLFSAIKKVSK